MKRMYCKLGDEEGRFTNGMVEVVWIRSYTQVGTVVEKMLAQEKRESAAFMDLENTFNNVEWTATTFMPTTYFLCLR